MEIPTHDLGAGTVGNVSEIPIATQENLDSLAIELHDQVCRYFIYGLEQDCADSELAYMKRIRALQERLQVLKDSKLLLTEEGLGGRVQDVIRLGVFSGSYPQ